MEREVPDCQHFVQSWRMRPRIRGLCMVVALDNSHGCLARMDA